MNKIFTTLLLLVISYTAYADDKDGVIDSLKTVIVNLEAENDSLTTELFRCRLEIYSLKSNAEGLPYGTKKLSTPIPFENKKNARFKVFQALEGYALAYIGEYHPLFEWSFNGGIVVLVGNYYEKQVVKMKNPMIVGRYSYKTIHNIEHNVPVIQPLEK